MILFSEDYLIYTLLGIILIPGILYSIITSARVNSIFNKYSKVFSSTNITGADAARKILQAQGISNVQVVRSEDSQLVDNFNPQTNYITLSSKVYDGTSISSLGVAAHEVGHAIQHSQDYAPAKVRIALVYVNNFMSTFVWPLILCGMLLDLAYIGGIVGDIFLYVGVLFFGASLLLTLCTLPVELDASKRALKLLVSTGCVDAMEVKGAKKVLSAAAKTYVAAILVSALNLLRFVLYFLSRRKD